MISCSAPGARQFVLLGIDAATAARLFQDIENIDVIGDCGRSGPALVRLPPEPDRARDAIAAARRILPPGATLEAVTGGDAGMPRYPTGVIQVRFRAVPDAARLDRLCDAERLCLAGRNPLAALQAGFTRRDDNNRSLDELCRRIASRDDVVRAWPECRAAYRRSRGAEQTGSE